MHRIYVLFQSQRGGIEVGQQYLKNLVNIRKLRVLLVKPYDALYPMGIVGGSRGRGMDSRLISL